MLSACVNRSLAGIVTLLITTLAAGCNREGSDVRHFSDRRDEALDWTDRMFTFNTTCFNSHVSQLATNYHLKSDTYQTTWAEPGISCESCHMPMTRFAAMGRSDHSMRPPTPATTIRFQSPNACNLCHADRDAAWADAWVRKWYPRDYQADTLRKAELIDAARKGQWERLPEMLGELAKRDNDAVYRTSLVCWVPRSRPSHGSPASAHLTSCLSWA